MDVYSFGIMLLEITERHPVFKILGYSDPDSAGRDTRLIPENLLGQGALDDFIEGPGFLGPYVNIIKASLLGLPTFELSGDTRLSRIQWLWKRCKHYSSTMSSKVWNDCVSVSKFPRCAFGVPSSTMT